MRRAEDPAAVDPRVSPSWSSAYCRSGGDRRAVAREALWRRFDAGAIATGGPAARLALVDRAGDDPVALARALDVPVPRRDRRSTRRVLLAAGAVVAVLAAAAGGWWLVDGSGGAGSDQSGPSISETTLVLPVPLPEPARTAPSARRGLVRAFDAIDGDEAPANPALLSDPPALPEGYDVADEDPIAPGTDPNVAMAVSAGTPAPEEILGRDVFGELLVTMRSFRYGSADDAETTARTVIEQSVCTYDIDGYDVPDRPEITGSVVSGPIPTTAFAGFRLAERRFSVAVVRRRSDDDADIEAARQLAGTIAGLELTPPGPLRCRVEPGGRPGGARQSGGALGPAEGRRGSVTTSMPGGTPSTVAPRRRRRPTAGRRAAGCRRCAAGRRRRAAPARRARRRPAPTGRSAAPCAGRAAPTPTPTPTARRRSGTRTGKARSARSKPANSSGRRPSKATATSSRPPSSRSASSTKP